MAKFLVLKILDSQSVVLPSTLVYGSVELRSYKADSECEIEALKESANSHLADFNHHSYCARIATIIDSDSILDSIDLADNSFSEILDLKSIEFPISNVKTSDIGFVKDLQTGVIYPIKREHVPSISFVVQQGDIQQLGAVNYILSQNNELSYRYQRSLHWLRNGKHEKNKQLKILFYWFSIEALFKESESDNVGGIARWFLGFPNGVRRNDVAASIFDRLDKHPRYAFWRKELASVVDNIRVFRNDSVHSGFRSVDFTKHVLELYYQVMVFAASRCQAAVLDALINGISTVSEFKEYIGLIFENNINITNDVHGNIIYSLDQIIPPKMTTA